MISLPCGHEPAPIIDGDTITICSMCGACWHQQQTQFQYIQPEPKGTK